MGRQTRAREGLGGCAGLRMRTRGDAALWKADGMAWHGMDGWMEVRYGAAASFQRCRPWLCQRLPLWVRVRVTHSTQRGTA